LFSAIETAVSSLAAAVARVPAKDAQATVKHSRNILNTCTDILPRD
jgi:hypothetical protein